MAVLKIITFFWYQCEKSVQVCAVVTFVGHIIPGVKVTFYIGDIAPSVRQATSRFNNVSQPDGDEAICRINTKNNSC